MGLMSYLSKATCVAFALGGLVGATSAGQSMESGRQLYDRHCRTCHGGTGPADSPIGPDLSGIVGKKAGAQASGIHSRTAIDSAIVWNRETLRRFLTAPRGEIPGSIMPVGVADPAELERLLDYLESLR
jgi:cytochrome c2